MAQTLGMDEGQHKGECYKGNQKTHFFEDFVNWIFGIIEDLKVNVYNNFDPAFKDPKIGLYCTLFQQFGYYLQLHKHSSAMINAKCGLK